MQDGQHGHPAKLRPSVREVLEITCREAPHTLSHVVQAALQERFGVLVSLGHLNRVRAELGIGSRTVHRKKTSVPWLVRDTELSRGAAILRNDVYDRKPSVNHWGTGRVTLAGDAAHPTTPTLGQGAGMAIEDSVVLAKELALVGNLDDYEAVENALRAYERNRIPRTTAIINESWQLSSTILVTNSLRNRIEETFLKATPKSVWRKRGEADATYEA